MREFDLLDLVSVLDLAKFEKLKIDYKTMKHQLDSNFQS